MPKSFTIKRPKRATKRAWAEANQKQQDAATVYCDPTQPMAVRLLARRAVMASMED